jgi:class 3 adenylate cyclase
MDLPDGVVTFLFTDIEGSTRLWEDAPDAMMDALRLHDEKVDVAVDKHHGVSVKPRGEGDSRFVVFRGADDAVAAVAEIQRQLDSVEWSTPRPLRVRASLHTGMAELETGDYYGSAVNRAARLRAIAHGGQTVLSGATFELVQDRLPTGVTMTDMGRHRLKDLTRPEHVGCSARGLGVLTLAGGRPVRNASGACWQRAKVATQAI